MLKAHGLDCRLLGSLLSEAIAGICACFLSSNTVVGATST